MELTQEIAVLQSAVVLAEKKFGCLRNLSKGDDTKTTVIVIDAVNEIVQGLRGHVDLKKQDELKFKMAAILLALYLTDTEKRDTNEFWFSVLQEMPTISSSVLFDVVKKCRLQQQLFTILNYVPAEFGLCILGDLVDYIDLESDDLDFALWIDLLEYLFLVDNPYLFEPDAAHMRTKLGPAEQDTCGQLARLPRRPTPAGVAGPQTPAFRFTRDGLVDTTAVLRLLQLLSCKLTGRRAAGRESITHLVCLVNALAGMALGRGMLADHVDFLALPLADFLREKSLRNTFSPAEAQALFLQTQDELVTRGLVRAVHCRLRADRRVLRMLEDLVLECTERDGELINLNALIYTANTNTGAETMTPSSAAGKGPALVARKPVGKGELGRPVGTRVISGHHCRMVLEQVAGRAGQVPGDGDGAVGPRVTGQAGPAPGDGAAVSGRVAARCAEVLPTPAGDLIEQLGEKKWDWCRVAVSAGLQGNREFFKQCLDDDIPKKLSTKWVDFMERNLQLLGSAAVMNKWLQFVSRFIVREKKSMSVTTIRMITLAAYRKLPLSAQAEVILHAHAHVTPLFEGGAQLQMKMTTAFNRLVKAKGNVKTSVGAVSELLLQAPQETLRKMVHDAVHNNGVARMMAEILESLPTAGALKRNDGENLLGHLIGEAAGWNLTWAQEQNLLAFVKYLFEMSTADAVLLDRAQVMRAVVLPNLVRPPGTGIGVTPSRALSLAQAAVGAGEAGRAITAGGAGGAVTAGRSQEAGSGGVAGALCGWRPAPLLLCLLGMLEGCGPSGGAGEAGSSSRRRRLKAQVVKLLGRLVELLTAHRHLLTGKSLTWLYNSVVRLHWTGLLHLAPLFSTESQPPKYPMRVPALLSEVAILPEGWVTFEYNGQGGAEYVTLEAVRVSAVRATLRPVVEAERPAPPDRYVRGVAAFAMLLPDSLACECEEMVSWLLSAGTCDRLQVTHTVSYTPVTVEHCAGVWRELSACRLLHDVLRIISDGGLRDTEPEVSLHVAQTHVALLNTHCLHPAASAPSGALCVLLTEVFCRLCHQMGLFSPGCREPLYVLLLDILQTYGTVRAEIKATELELKVTELEVKGMTTQKSLANQVAAMTTVSELCSPEEQSMLGKTLSKYA